MKTGFDLIDYKFFNIILFLSYLIISLLQIV